MKDIYIVRDGQRLGPFTEEQLVLEQLTPDTLVWHEGMTDWQPAANVPEMARFLVSTTPEVEESAFGTYAEIPPEPVSVPPVHKYYAMMGNTRIGPMAVTELQAYGVRPDTPVWCKEMADWQPASTRPDIMMYIGGPNSTQPYGNPRGQQGYVQQPGFGLQNGYNQQPGNGYVPQHYNWMTWAIIGTILGGLFSCIGLIFGAIGISKASSANRAYAIGDDFSGDQYNSTAKTMTIISLVLAGLGIIFNIMIFSVGTAQFLTLIG